MTDFDALRARAEGIAADLSVLVELCDAIEAGGGGGVASVVAGTNVTVDDTDPANPIVSAAGSAPSAGSPVVRAFPFAYNSANILTGHTVYTPTIGDILLDAWIEIDIAFDGTTPNADIGQFVGTNHGWFYACDPDGLRVDTADDASFGTGTLTQGLNATTTPSSLLMGLVRAWGGSPSKRQLPLKFTTTDPLKIVVSQNGANTGDDPGSTQGAAVLYLSTVTPL